MARNELPHFNMPLKAAEAYHNLKEGNKRFANNNTTPKNLSNAKRKQLVEYGQKPFAVIIGCSDSRVPPEIIFDCSIGDLFTIRTAGNTMDSLVLGSIEYALLELNVPLVMILGHNHCGAVNISVKTCESDNNLSDNCNAITQKIKPCIDKVKNLELDFLSLCDAVVEENIRSSISLLPNHSSIIEELLENNQISIVGAKYKLETGEVFFLKPQ